MFNIEKFGLKRGDLVLLDSAPIIYFIEGREARGSSTGDRASVVNLIVDSARSGEIRLAASSIVWAECLIGPLGAANTHRADEYRRLLSDSRTLVIEPADVAIAEEAARLLASPSPPGFADAFHIATAAVINADVIITNDEAWRKTIKAASLSASPSLTAKYRSMRILIVDELTFEV